MLPQTLVIFTTNLFIISGGYHSLQVHNLRNNPGVVALNKGLGFLKIGEHKIYHIIYLDNYKPILRRLGNLINGLKSFEEIKDMTESIELKFKNAQEIYSTLIPITREKRGILNFWGQVSNRSRGTLIIMICSN